MTKNTIATASGALITIANGAPVIARLQLALASGRRAGRPTTPTSPGGPTEASSYQGTQGVQDYSRIRRDAGAVAVQDRL
jgi:hypothetical protein